MLSVPENAFAFNRSHSQHLTFMKIFETLSSGPRLTIRRPGAPDSTGRCVVHWMQRALYDLARKSSPSRQGILYAAE
jgi:hypothetical protein